MLTINKHNLINLIVYFFVISNILDMRGGIGFKFVSFLFLCGTLFLKFPKINSSKLLFFIILIFFYALSLIITQINGGNLSISYSYNLFFLTIIVLLLVSELVDKNVILYFIMNALFWCSLMIFFGYFFSFIYPNESILDILKIFAADFDEREEIRSSAMIIVPKIYFNFTLFLPSVFIYFLFRNNYLKSLLVSIAILLSLSRAAIVVTLLLLIVYVFKSQSLKKLLTNIFLLFAFSLVLAFIIDLFVPSIFIHILNLGDSSQGTVATRIDQINMISDVFSDNIINFLFGMGPGTPIYSNFHGMNIYNIEIAPLEFIRKYGVIFFAIIFSLMFKIILKNFKIDKSKSYLLIALFLCTFSNPILTSPLFIFIFILCNNNSLKTV